MKKTGLFLFLIFFSVPLFSAVYRVEDISFYPDRIFIGDEVTCRLIIGKDLSAQCLPPLPETLPQSGSVTVRSVTVQD